MSEAGCSGDLRLGAVLPWATPRWHLPACACAWAWALSNAPCPDPHPTHAHTNTAQRNGVPSEARGAGILRAILHRVHLPGDVRGGQHDLRMGRPQHHARHLPTQAGAARCLQIFVCGPENAGCLQRSQQNLRVVHGASAPDASRPPWAHTHPATATAPWAIRPEVFVQADVPGW